MITRQTLLSKIISIFVVGPPVSDKPAPEMTRDQLARLKADFIDSVNADEEIGFSSGKVTLKVADFAALIRLAEKSFTLEDAAKQQRE